MDRMVLQFYININKMKWLSEEQIVIHFKIQNILRNRNICLQNNK